MKEITKEIPVKLILTEEEMKTISDLYDFLFRVCAVMGCELMDEVWTAVCDITNAYDEKENPYGKYGGGDYTIDYSQVMEGR